MIDYSISDQTKQIWINLQLYFESYDLYNFIEFSGIFLNLFRFIFNFYLIKIIKKLAKWVHLSREPTWMRRGMQGHVALPRGRTRVPAWHWGDVYIYLFYIHRLSYI